MLDRDGKIGVSFLSETCSLLVTPDAINGPASIRRKNPARAIKQQVWTTRNVLNDVPDVKELP